MVAEKRKFHCDCGGTMYIVNRRANGWWNTLHDDDGTVCDTDLSQVKLG